MSEVFLLGAGFSRAISKDMPLLADLGRSLDKQLHETPSLPRYQKILARLDGDVELYLSYLSENCPWQRETEALDQRARFLEAQSYIAETVREAESKAFSQAPTEWLGTLIQCWLARRSAVITLNYDTWVERHAIPALRQVSLADLYHAPLQDLRARTGAGLYGSEAPVPFKLLKLHGSVNWYYSGSLEFSGEQVYYDAPDPHNSDRDEYLRTDLVPFIVPPVAAKSPFFASLALRAIWRAAAAALRQARTIYCLGYSMPLTDLTMRLFLSSSIPERNVNIYIVNLVSDQGIRERYETALPQPPASYTLHDDFLSDDDPIPKFATWLEQAAKET